MHVAESMWSRARAAESMMFPHPPTSEHREMRIRTRSASSARGGAPSARAPPAAGAACAWHCTEHTRRLSAARLPLRTALRVAAAAGGQRGQLVRCPG
eukprot:5383331-Pyramimonas_sp.AAC.1